MKFKKFLAAIKPYWPEISALAVAAAPHIFNIAQQIVAANPGWDHSIAWMIVILARLSKSPLTKA